MLARGRPTNPARDVRGAPWKAREVVITREMVITKNTGLEVIEKAG